MVFWFLCLAIQAYLSLYFAIWGPKAAATCAYLKYSSCHLEHLQCVSKKRLAFEIQISQNVLNLPDKYNYLESFSES